MIIRKRIIRGTFSIFQTKDSPQTSNLIFQISICILALTGFVCTHKIQAEEECLSSNVLCYECDSRYDANCADPFDLASTSLVDQALSAGKSRTAGGIENDTSVSIAGNQVNQTNNQPNDSSVLVSNSTIPTIRQQKKMPAINVCHGCCVKITSKTLEGVTYVKRTCTTSLQINFFMVGLVCMKESGDRGKMCFCETDYCNGQLSSHLPRLGLMIALMVFASVSQLLVRNHFGCRRPW